MAGRRFPPPWTVDDQLALAIRITIPARAKPRATPDRSRPTATPRRRRPPGMIISRRLVASLGSFGPAGISASVAAGCAIDQWENLVLDRLNPAGRLRPLCPVPLDERPFPW